VALRLYEGDTSEVVASELATSSRLFVRTFQSLAPRFERREFFYSPAHPRKVTILWRARRRYTNANTIFETLTEPRAAFHVDPVTNGPNDT